MKISRQIGIVLSLVGLASCSSGGFSNDVLLPWSASLSANGSDAELGKVAFQNGNVGLAITYYQAAVQRAPTSITALNGLAASYDRLGRFELARRYYDRALKQNPMDAQTLNNIGYSYVLQGKGDMAGIFLKQALAEAKNNPTIRANIKRADAVATASGVANIPVSPSSTLVSTGIVNDSYGQKTQSLVNSLRPSLHIERVTPLVQRLAEKPVDSRDVPVAHVARAAYLKSAEKPTAKNAAPVAAVRLPKILPSSRSRSNSVLIAANSAHRRATIEVANGTGRARMAARMRAYLDKLGILVARLTNAPSFSNRVTTVVYRPGWESTARALVDTLPVKPELVADKGSYADVKVTLGADLLDFDAGLKAKAEGVQYVAR